MKLVNGHGSVRLITALSALALTLAGSALVANPAHADEVPDGAKHCVVTTPGPPQKECFATYDEAKAYVVSKAEILPKKEAPTAAHDSTTSADRTARSALVFGPVLIYTGFDFAFWNPLGGSLWVIGLNGPCTTPTTNIDYPLSSLGSYNNRISSELLYSNCWNDSFDGTNFTGSSTGYSGSEILIGDLNNDRSSFLFS